MPPALIFHTAGDPLADEAVAYADKLRQAGNHARDIALPPADIKNNQDRCDITADDPCFLAMKRFMAELSLNTPSSVTPNTANTAAKGAQP